MEITCDDFRREPSQIHDIRVSSGDEFEVTLCSNASTGYSWADEASVADASKVEQIGHEYVAPVLSKAGEAGVETWKFKALATGTSSVSFTYGQPWDGGEKAAWLLTLSVVAE